MKLIYMDLCALKRPFDDQSDGRVFVETSAVTKILDSVHAGAFKAGNSWALTYENGMNPNPVRRNRVAELLRRFGKPSRFAESIKRRAVALRDAGIQDLDALHLAFAEDMLASHFITCDDEILQKAAKMTSPLRVVDPVAFVKEVGI